MSSPKEVLVFLALLLVWNTLSAYIHIYIYEELKMMLTLPPKYIGRSEFWFFEADRFKMNSSSYWFLEYIEEVDILIENTNGW